MPNAKYGAAEDKTRITKQKTAHKKDETRPKPRFVFFALPDELFVTDDTHLGQTQSLGRRHDQRY